MRLVLVAVSAVIAVVALWQVNTAQSSDEHKSAKGEGRKQVKAEISFLEPNIAGSKMSGLDDGMSICDAHIDSCQLPSEVAGYSSNWAPFTAAG